MSALVLSFWRSSAAAAMAGRGSRRRRRRKSAIKQAGNGRGDGDARCPPHPEFFCGAMEDDTEGAAPRVPFAPGPSRSMLPFLGLGGTKEGGAEGGSSGKIREGTAAVQASTTTTSTSIPRASDLDTLLRARKLTLILDLDHTLLNSTALDDVSPVEQANGFTRYAKGDPNAGLFRLGLAGIPMFTKLRPFARGFLEQASAIFEMSVYTLGSRRYARAVVKLLDPDGAYFGGRVVSSDESTRRDRKSLDVVPGTDSATVLILDDSSLAWPEHQENLIVMDRYLYFADSCRNYGVGVSSLAELRRDEREHDGPLAVALQVLTRVHQGFFDSVLGDRCPDVREVIRAMRREVLRGCTVAFSRVTRLEDVVGDHPMWKLAEQLGAICAAEADATVSHVVALDPGTDQVRWARDNGKYLVNPKWIFAASFRWCRPCEQEFPVTGAGLCEQEYLDLLKHLGQVQDMFYGVAVDGSSSCIPGQAEQEEEEGAFEQEDDDIDQSSMSTNGRKRTSSTSTTATSPERKTERRMVRIMKSLV